MSFCPACGKETRGGLCEDCRPLPEIKVKDILIKICSSCNKYQHKNKWAGLKNIEDAIARVAKDSIKEDVSDIAPILPENIKRNPGIVVDFEIEAKKDNDAFRFPAKLLFTICENCSKKKGTYMEGTLQLRNIDDEMLGFVKTYCKNNRIHISKTIEEKNGYDLDVSDQKKVQNLGHELQKHFGGLLKISPRIFTKNKQTSKDVYRVNVYYEAPDYKKGDVIKVGRQLIKIASSRKTLTGYDIMTGKKVSIDMKNKEFILLKPFQTTVSRTHPHIEVLDPETYQSVMVQNKKDVKADETAEAVNDEGLFYLV